MEALASRGSLTDAQWETLARWIEQPKPLTDWVSAWNVPAGSVVSRAQLHDVYGGNSRVMAGPSGKSRNVFLFLNRAAVLEDLTPRVSGDVLLAPGHVQLGDYAVVESLPIPRWITAGEPQTTSYGHVRERQAPILRLRQLSGITPLENWLAPNRRIVLLTVFRKTRMREDAEVDRAKQARKVCEAERHAAHDEFTRDVTKGEGS